MYLEKRPWTKPTAFRERVNFEIRKSAIALEMPLSLHYNEFQLDYRFILSKSELGQLYYDTFEAVPSFSADVPIATKHSVSSQPTLEIILNKGENIICFCMIAILRDKKDFKSN